ncbi:hypothetical protein ASE69_17610 [Sphingomonas sp. Leaf208]|uniref:lysozyme inhibitor LprI family protein n=1 Tax=Sphingomonas sp. Leaf208 TaxID=1735679 RepID=UPI0006F1F6CF|nr:lysozyme inhibitor LprI family protein [Sphingomonas sp. Leaf208]KQM55174.1 hypothetical protein ASE69_17610 [Sphingomonas sp. Leaf208]
MKQFILAAVATAGAITALPATAQTAGAFMANPAFQGPRPARCTTTVEMQRCAAADLRTADAAMSVRYNALRARLRPAAQQTLLAEQRAWLKSRDRDCLAKGRGGGSSASLYVAQCWVSTTQARTAALGAKSSQGTSASVLPASAFVGRWRGGEGTYMKIARRGAGFVIDNQWGLDADMQGVFTGTMTPGGLSFRRNGVTETARPSKGDAVNLSALRGKKDCLMVSKDEGYCRY